MNAPLAARILLTLAYTDQFDFPLSEGEVWQRLLGGQADSPSIKKELNSLVRKKLLIKQRDGYSLVGGENKFEIRTKQHHQATLKSAEVDEFVDLVRWLPWVWAVAVTGSMAVDVAKKNDDIDFLIITQPDRLWLSRLVVTMIAWWKGKRRSWKQEEENSWCFNLWLSQKWLRVPARERSIYTAYEVCQAKFVFDRGRVEEKFLFDNGWVCGVLPHYFYSQWGQMRRKRLGQSEVGSQDLGPFSFSNTVEFIGNVVRPIFDLVWGEFEKAAYWFQYLYMRPHMTSERVTRDTAFFHPRDTKGMIMKGWRQALEKLI